MQWECENESGIDISVKRILPVDCSEVKEKGSYQDNNSKKSREEKYFSAVFIRIQITLFIMVLLRAGEV